MKHYDKLSKERYQLWEQLCDNMSFDYLRPMTKEEVIVGQRIFSNDGDGFYTCVIEELRGFYDLDFDCFVEAGTTYGIHGFYVLKDSKK